ncbi:MAG: hypothetical protein LBQ97_08105 [Fusobacteriaceae bacterium]|jgi:L-asparaginase II|nr:hypothetical protein [Fusobacteriaceae bacterium]
MDVALVDVTRGDVVESRHRGCAVVADGSGKHCSVPVHAMPIRNMATGYARFTEPDNRNDHGKPVGKLKPVFTLA